MRGKSFLIAMLTASSVFAQVSASISGVVLDPSGALVPKAAITVKSLETGAVRTTTANDSGTYRISSLPLGPQEITVESHGFKKLVWTGVSLAVGEEAVVNLTLTLGVGSEDAVEIREDAEIVNTTTASDSGVVGSREVKDLPLNGRSFDNLITLNPRRHQLQPQIRQHQHQ